MTLDSEWLDMRNKLRATLFVALTLAVIAKAQQDPEKDDGDIQESGLPEQVTSDKQNLKDKVKGLEEYVPPERTSLDRSIDLPVDI